MDRWLSVLADEVLKLIPPRSVREHARATGLVERDRDIKPAPLFWSFLFGTTQPDGSVTAVQEFYKAFTGQSIAYSSIQQWITSELTDLLTGVFDHLSIELGTIESSVGGRFDRFGDVLIPDATDCTLSPGSLEAFPGYGNDHAGAKLHVIESLASRTPMFTSITPVRNHESAQFEIGKWVEDALVLFDLGFLEYERLVRIERSDGWFVTRLNHNANPEMTEPLRRWRGNAISLKGKHLQEVLPDLYRSELDVIARFGAGRQDAPLLPEQFRVIGIRHDGETDEDAVPDADHDYHLYATNLPEGWFEPRELAALYSNRWSVETLILESKSVFGLNEIPVRREEAVNCFMTASMLMVMISRYLFGRVRARLGPARNRSLEEQTDAQPLRFSKRLCRFGTELLETIAEKLGYCWDVGVVIIEGAIDPNRDRHTLTERVAHGVVDPSLTKAGELASLRPG